MKNDGTHVEDRMLEIYDCSGLTFSQVTCVSGLKMLSKSLGLCQANYPEDLCQTYVINVPGFFSFCWKIIKPGEPEDARSCDFVYCTVT